MPKGFGSENVSRIFMLKPTQGKQEIIDCVLQSVKDAGPNACPPYVLGIGIVGTMDKAALLAKKALMRNIEQAHQKQHIAELEKEILEQINNTKIGPQGYGGDITALSVNIEVYPTHIAGLPVAINIGCNSDRHAGCVI